MSTAKRTPSWPDDREFEDSTISKVDAGERGWTITKVDGWSFWVPAESPIEPQVGMSVRMYGQGIGSVVRGLYLDGHRVFYRTDAEQRQHSAEELYGKDAADVVARWDAGRAIWSVEMGGFGPGYEQALQIAMVEFLRHRVAGGSLDDEALTIRLAPLALSGAQWGAAKSLAQRFFADGPHSTLAAFEDARKIQVSKHFPTIEPLARAGAA